MSRVRDDLGGVLHLPDGRILKAGDEVPEGVVVGDHALDPGTSSKKAEKDDEKPTRKPSK